MQLLDFCRRPAKKEPFVNGMSWSPFLSPEPQKLGLKTATSQEHGWESPLRVNKDGSDPERVLVQNLPVIRNQKFVGRQSILEDLHRYLIDPFPTLKDITITGSSGIGKTALALEYAYSHLGDYCSILWLSGEGDLFAQLQAATARFPSYLQPSTSAPSHEQTLAAARALFMQPGRHLVIIDGFTGHEADLRRYFQGEKLRYLVLGRDASLPNTRRIELLPLSEDEALEVLQKDCDFDEQDAIDARALCALLAGRPDAVVKAAATLSYGVRRPADLLQSLRDMQAKMGRLSNFIAEKKSEPAKKLCAIEPSEKAHKKSPMRDIMISKGLPPLPWDTAHSNGLRTDIASHHHVVASPWSDDYLESMRSVGDSLADETVTALSNIGADLWALLRKLPSLDPGDEDALPAPLRDYLHATAEPLADMNEDALRLATALFERNGPMMMMILGCYSLPAAYAAKKGVQVVYRSARLANDTWRRTRGTAQMVIDVLHRNGLHAGGRGVRTIQRVRLTHAAVRRMLLVGDPPWDPALGTPINQEDLAGTMMTFSYTVLDGLTKMDTAATAEEQEAFLHVWSIIGRMLGIKKELVPADMEQAQALSLTIERRHFGASPEGKFMTAALIKMMKGNTPGTLLDGLAESLMFHCLGEPIATMLGIERPDWTRHLVYLGRLWAWADHEMEEAYPSMARLGTMFGEAFLFGLYQAGPEHHLPGITIPRELVERWHLERWQQGA